MQWNKGRPTKNGCYLTAIKVYDIWIYQISWWENNKWIRNDSDYGEIETNANYWCKIKEIIE